MNSLHLSPPLSMFASLPAELAIAIIVEAAEHYVVADRATAVSLAMTAHYVFTLVRPILLRRFFITDSNRFRVDDVLAEQETGVLVLDLNIASSHWRVTPRVVNCLTSLRHLRGITDTVKSVISLLPASSRASLRDVQLWDEEVIPNVPPGLTHVCIYASDLGDPPLNYMVSWLRSAQSITHIGVEMVTRGDYTMDLSPDDLARGLATVLDTGGTNLQRVAVRVCGELSNDELWARLLAVLKAWSSTGDMVAVRASRRIGLWRDRRMFEDWKDDVQAGIDDPLAGIDIWSEARLLADW